MAGDSGDKTEKASPKKRRDARKKGDVLMSKDVVTVSTLVATFSVLWFTGGAIVGHMEEFFFFCLTLMTQGGSNLVESSGTVIGTTLIKSYISVIMWPVLTTILVACIVTGYQTKLLFSLEALKPSFSKMNPLEGIKKMFSLKSIVDTIKNIFKISILFYIVYDFYIDTVLTFSRYFYMHPALAGGEIMSHVITVVFRIALAFAAIACFDYGFQWYEYEKKLKMSKQDQKDEYKQTEGDPQVKGKIKQKQFQMAQARMMQDVQAADVVVRNPTHYAVALRYRPGVDATPIILAMGEDNLAFRIITIAERFEVPVIENVKVARALYATGEVGHPIPEDLYTAVANIILVVMKINKQNINQFITPPKP